ncbi:hypothetical protein CLOP_g24477, partial [Closterium sp. NIES-67]
LNAGEGERLLVGLVEGGDPHTAQCRGGGAGILYPGEGGRLPRHRSDNLSGHYSAYSHALLTPLKGGGGGTGGLGAAERAGAAEGRAVAEGAGSAAEAAAAEDFVPMPVAQGPGAGAARSSSRVRPL